MKKEWFSSSKDGLAKIARRRGLSYVLLELIQNSWDAGARKVVVELCPVDGQPFVDVIVADDAEGGFADLAHAWTLFAESAKKTDPEKRGLFNFGEKLVLAICDRAEITSTRGGVIFDKDGRRATRRRTESGSHFKGRVRMTREELAEVRLAASRIIPPAGVETWFDREVITTAPPLKVFETTLPTMVADAEGVVKERQRKTKVEIYNPMFGDGRRVGWIHEMGIPVCETGDPWDVNVLQKVPVNLERSGLPGAYLQLVRVRVANAMADLMTPGQATSETVRAVLEDERCEPALCQKAVEALYGPKRAIYDPSDPEANNSLVASGYRIIHGGAFGKIAWANIKASDAALPSGTIRPTPLPYSTDPGAPARVLVPESEWTEGMRNIAAYAMFVARALLGIDLQVRIDKGKRGQDWGACYGDRELTWNLATLGKGFFEEGPTPRVNSFLIHELAHHKASNHLSEKYHLALHHLGAMLVELALREPGMFRGFGWERTGSMALESESQEGEPGRAALAAHAMKEEGDG